MMFPIVDNVLLVVESYLILEIKILGMGLRTSVHFPESASFQMHPTVYEGRNYLFCMQPEQMFAFSLLVNFLTPSSRV